METHTVQRLGVFSLAIVVGAIGLLWGVIVTIAWLGVAVLGSATPGITELLVSTLGAGLSGIVAGGVTAILYNAAASLVGGLELDLAAVE